MSSSFVTPGTTFSVPSKVESTSSTVRLLIQTILRANQKAKRGVSCDQEMEDARIFLESLPLTTEEFGLASSRLRNANRYRTSGEFGAASWELTTLRKLLSRHDS